MHYIGCDQHKHYSVVVAKDSQGMLINQEKLYHNDRGSIEKYFDKQPEGSIVALEASGFEPWLCDLIEQKGINVKLVHPRRTRAIAAERIKTDKLSAGVLADLLRGNLLAEAYKAPVDIRHKRSLMRHRQYLVNLRAQVKNKVHSILSYLGITTPEYTDLFGKAGTQYLKEVDLVQPYRSMVDECLELIDQINKRIQSFEKTIRSYFCEDPRINLLKTIPGIGDILAPFILAEWEKSTGFPTALSWLLMRESFHRCIKAERSRVLAESQNRATNS